MIANLAAVTGRDVSRETADKLEAFRCLVEEESRHQNLVSRATLIDFWSRHLLDSAQLLRFAPEHRTWSDIGSGAGLPGIVIACFDAGPVTLIEPRRLRAEFLQRVIAKLGLNASVHHGKAESAAGAFDVITARAVAPLGKLLDISHHLSTGKSLFLFPKGRSAHLELAEAQRSWQGTFHVERSATDEDSLIVVGREVRRRGQ